MGIHEIEIEILQQAEFDFSVLCTRDFFYSMLCIVFQVGYHSVLILSTILTNIYRPRYLNIRVTIIMRFKARLFLIKTRLHLFQSKFIYVIISEANYLVYSSNV